MQAAIGASMLAGPCASEVSIDGLPITRWNLRCLHAFQQMAEIDRKSRERAEAVFKIREQQRADAPVALGQYRQAEQNARDQLRRLREARLAREASEK